MEEFVIHITLVEFSTPIGVQTGKLVGVSESDKTLLVFQDGGAQWISYEQVISFELKSFELLPTGPPAHLYN